MSDRKPATSRFADVDENGQYDAEALRLAPSDRQLHAWGTYARTAQLERLLAGEVTPRLADIAELWGTFRGAEDYHDAETTLGDFARWLLGELGGRHDTDDAAAVLW